MQNRRSKGLVTQTPSVWLVKVASMAVLLGLCTYYLSIERSRNAALTSILNLIKPTGKLASLGGNLTVFNSPLLSVCQGEALRASLAAQGWARTFSNTNNLVWAGQNVIEQGKTTCCYAKSEKSWVEDPQGVQWETFLTTGERIPLRKNALRSA